MRGAVGIAPGGALAVGPEPALARVPEAERQLGVAERRLPERVLQGRRNLVEQPGPDRRWVALERRHDALVVEAADDRAAAREPGHEEIAGAVLESAHGLAPPPAGVELEAAELGRDDRVHHGEDAQAALEEVGIGDFDVGGERHGGILHWTRAPAQPRGRATGTAGDRHARAPPPLWLESKPTSGAAGS